MRVSNGVTIWPPKEIATLNYKNATCKRVSDVTIAVQHINGKSNNCQHIHQRNAWRCQFLSALGCLHVLLQKLSPRGTQYCTFSPNNGASPHGTVWYSSSGAIRTLCATYHTGYIWCHYLLPLSSSTLHALTILSAGQHIPSCLAPSSYMLWWQGVQSHQEITPTAPKHQYSSSYKTTRWLQFWLVQNCQMIAVLTSLQNCQMIVVLASLKLPNDCCLC